MMEWMRRRMKAFLWFVIVAFVVTIFYYWGAGGSLFGTGEWFVKVNGTKISTQEVENRVQQLQNQYKNAADPQRLREYAQQDVMRRTLLKQEAQKQRIEVSNSTLANRIKRIFPTRRDLQDSINYGYVKVGEGQLIAWSDLEDSTKSSAILDILQERIRAGARLTEAELQQAFLKEKEERDIRWLAINIEASPLEDAEAKHKIDSYLQMARKGQAFDQLAKQYSDDAQTKDKGGFLMDGGFIEKGHIIPEFEKALFSMKPGDVSEPVKTKYGYHLLKVEDRKTESRPNKDGKSEPVQQVRARHLLVWLRPGPETLRTLKAKADDLARQLQTKPNFSEAAKQVSASGTAKGLLRDATSLGKYPEVNRAIEQAFLLKLNDVSTAIEIDQPDVNKTSAIFIVQPVASKPPKLTELPANRAAILAKALKRKSDDLYQLWFGLAAKNAKVEGRPQPAPQRGQ